MHPADDIELAPLPRAEITNGNIWQKPAQAMKRSSDSTLCTGQLGCPKCHAAIDVGAQSGLCTGCQSEYLFESGVLCTDRSDAFLGEFDGPRMMEFVRLAREQGWRRTVEERMAREDPGARAIVLSPDRASFVELLNPSRKGSVLDLGAGMGAVSLCLSRTFDRVYAVDQTFERLAFLQVVAEQEGADSIRTVCHRDVFNLPFSSNSLDAAVMVGVFEYFPMSYADVSVGDVQARALAELNRVLAPGGVLFIATKNRFGWPYWAGARDNSRLRFGSLLPRWMANRVSMALLHRPYRTVTDSYWRYQTLLLEAGFLSPHFYWPARGYQASTSWVDLSDPDAVKTEVRAYPAGWLKRRLLSALAATGGMRFVVPHFGIVAKKPG